MAVSSVAESTSRAMKAEHEADRKIADAKKRSDEELKKIDAETARLKDVYEKRAEDERDRYEKSLQKQQLDGYERIKTARQEKQREVQKTKNRGETELARVQENTQDTIEQTERQSAHRVSETEAKLQEKLKQTELIGQDKIKIAKDTSDKNAALLTQQNNERLENLAQDAQKHFEKTRENYNRATLESNDRYDKNYQSKLEEHQTQFNELNKKVAQNIQTLKQDTSDKLAAYATRNEDPFYRLMTTNAELEEGKDAYILTAEIPPHEQKNVVVSIQGNQVVMSGTRKNQEQITLDSGHKQSTSSFQSFTETFPLNGPVDPKGVIREYVDGVLTVRIPKKSTYSRSVGDRRVASSAPPRQDRPQFPENLPNIQPAGRPDKPLDRQR